MEPKTRGQKKPSCFLPFMKAKFKTKFFGSHFLNEKLTRFVPSPQCQFMWISLSILYQKKNWTKFTKTNIVPSPNNTSLAVISTLLSYFDSSHNLGGQGVAPPLNTPPWGSTGAPLRKDPPFGIPHVVILHIRWKKQTFRLIGNTPYHFENYRITFFLFCLACLAIIVLVGENSML